MSFDNQMNYLFDLHAMQNIFAPERASANWWLSLHEGDEVVAV